VPAGRYDDVVATFSAPQAVGLRLNALRVAELGLGAAGVEERLKEAGVPFEGVEGVPGAYTVPAPAREVLMASSLYAEGAVYLQNVASQLPTLVLDPQPGERVLDLCAAPGSKTGQIAAMMGGEGNLVAVEKSRPRFYRMVANLRDQGAQNVRTVLGSGTGYWHREPESFDRVLLDAPCSTEGRFRADDPETTRYWSERKIKEMRAVQERLLFGAVQALRPGGVLVYSTCTFAPEENEGVVARALRTFGDAVEVVDAGLPEAGPVASITQPGLSDWKGRPFDSRVRNARRVLPDGTLEAFFIARLRKVSRTVRG
jgi:16S rRNA (cytosine1407-C5)-methyltransferase